jgi:hypothetical protein
MVFGILLLLIYNVGAPNPKIMSFDFSINSWLQQVKWHYKTYTTGIVVEFWSRNYILSPSLLIFNAYEQPADIPSKDDDVDS